MGAIVLRIILIFFALTLLAIPFLKIVGALLLLWIGVKLLLPEHGEGHANISGSDRLWGAVKTVIIADFVMSVDNVIAIAGAAESSGTGHGMTLVVFGVLVSIPIIVWGSQLVIKLMDRYPAIITLGAMLLGWIAGTMAVTDPALVNPDVMSQMPKIVATDMVRYGAGIAGALFVIALGKWIAARQAAPAAEAAAAQAAVPVTGHLRRVLLAVDGSETAARAVQHMLSMRQDLRDAVGTELHLLNVQRPVSGDVSAFVARQSLQEYYQERSEAALTPARALLAAGGVTYQEHRRVGPPGATIAEVARAQGCDLIVIGARGLANHTGALLGSVAQSTIEHASVPVLVVK